MNKDTTVILWLYHTDLAQEFYDLLNPIQDLVKIRLCLCEDQDNKNCVRLFSSLKNVESITYYPNIGVDIYSFLSELSSITTPYFLKLHSKKSYWGTHFHCNWRSVLLDTFLGDRDTLIRNINILRSGAGYLSARPFTYRNVEEKHKENIDSILKLICCPKIKAQDRKFTGGNMFGGNTALFQKVLLHNRNELLNLISYEKGKVDDVLESTYSHSLERIFGYIGGLYEYDFLYAAPTAFKILSPEKNKRRLRFRIMQNRCIYSLDQANIYGKIINKNKGLFSVKWLHVDNIPNQHYTNIGKNAFINSKHLS